MPYVNKPRPLHKEWLQEKARGESELKKRRERDRARYELDKKGVNRSGMDISHSKALSKGGNNTHGYKLESPSKNRARNYQK